MAAYLKERDPNHLVTVGLEGFWGAETQVRQLQNLESFSLYRLPYDMPGPHDRLAMHGRLLNPPQWIPFFLGR
jgi:endo-1,4-beta-mannosidase